MQPGLRPLIGTIALVLFLVVYVLVAMAFAVAVLPDAGRIAEFMFYAIAGLAWVPIAGVLLSWMYRRRSRKD